MNTVTNPTVSIIFPNYNGCKDCLSLLASLKNCDFPSQEIEVIMVDNASTDDSVKTVKEAFPDIKIITLDHNVGPGEARNKGAAKAEGEYLFLTDNDVEFMASSLEPLIKLISSDARIGVAGGKILEKNTHRLVSCGYTFNRWLGIETGDKNPDQQKECDWVAGAFMMIKKGVFNEIGGFESRFFFYAEEADLCLKAKEKGLRVVYAPEAIIYHGKFNSSAKIFSPSEDYFNYYVGKFLLILKHASFWEKMTAFLFHLTLAIPLRFLLQREEHPLLKYKAWRYAQTLLYEKNSSRHPQF